MLLYDDEFLCCVRSWFLILKNEFGPGSFVLICFVFFRCLFTVGDASLAASCDWSCQLPCPSPVTFPPKEQATTASLAFLSEQLSNGNLNFDYLFISRLYN